MKALQRMILCLAIATSGILCPAQDSQIPFRQIEKEAQLSARAGIPPNEIAAVRESAMLPESSSSSSFVLVRPSFKQSRTLSPGFILLSGMHLGLAVLDVELTQHCIANDNCVEGNPLMPSSHAGQLGVNLALVGYGSFVSYKLKKQDRKLWLLSPTIGISMHTLGIATGIAHW